MTEEKPLVPVLLLDHDKRKVTKKPPTRTPAGPEPRRISDRLFRPCSRTKK